MKSIIMPGHEQLDKKAKDQLFKEVKETVAKTTNEKDQNKKLFTVQDMWNRQRQAKSASAMMRRWNLN
ncbi:MAG: hypothetical protein E6H08_03895 [Bacteroidetes bacterium]|jgi:hypothetical protein|nr:MAG: hypothetical protein E6H08_03895 [Bacteroidota bacterium]